MGQDGRTRTITTTGGAGVVDVDLDVSRSQLWLHEASPILGYMNPVMGVMSEYQLYYGARPRPAAKWQRAGPGQRTRPR